MSVNPRIIIIGAGPAGYSAACKLLEHGLTNITILEAENRMGGRVHSVDFGNAVVDLGGQWCHGEKNNIVYEMVKDLNLLSQSACNYREFLFVDSQGNFTDKKISNKLMDLLFALGEDNEQLKVQTGSFGDYIIKKYNEKLTSDHPQIDRKVTKQVLEWYEKIINNINACSNWLELSARDEFEDCEGDQTLNWKGKGYKTIFSVLRKEIPDASKKLPVDEKIVLNKEVVKIVWEDKTKNDKEMTVECLDGSKYKADHVIITVSLGVLKESYKTLFEPELPSNKKNAILGLSFGTVNKIILKFPNKWWSGPACFDLLWLQEDSEKLVTEFPEGPTKNGKSWLEGIIGFHSIDNNPNVLLAFINGECVRDFESLSDDVVIRGCVFLLKKFLGKHYEIPSPDSILRTAWSTNKYFRGSYSHRSLETNRLNASPADLASPLGDNALLFAGEATNTNFYSTVHGAIGSGFREADRIIAQHKSGQKSKA